MTENLLKKILGDTKMTENLLKKILDMYFTMFSNLLKKIIGRIFSKRFWDTKMTENLLKKIIKARNDQESLKKILEGKMTIIF
jgi:hypothetical protein